MDELDALLAELDSDPDPERESQLHDAIEDRAAEALDRGDLERAARALDRVGRPLAQVVRRLCEGAPLWEVAVDYEFASPELSRAGPALARALGGRLEAHGSELALAVALRVYERIEGAWLPAERLRRRGPGADETAVRGLISLLSARDDADSAFAIASLARYVDPDAALAAIDRALALAPDELRSVRMGIRLWFRRDRERARAIAHEYAARHPDDGRALFTLGTAASRAAPEMAREAFRQAGERGSRYAAEKFVEASRGDGTWDALPADERDRWLALSAPTPDLAPPEPAEPEPAEPASGEPELPRGAVVQATWETRAGPVSGAAFLVEPGPLLVTVHHRFGARVRATSAQFGVGGEAGRALPIPYASAEEAGDVAAFPVAELGGSRPLPVRTDPLGYDEPVWVVTDAGLRRAEQRYTEGSGVVLELGGDGPAPADGSPALDRGGRVAGMVLRAHPTPLGRISIRALGPRALAAALADARSPPPPPTLRRRYRLDVPLDGAAPIALDVDTGEPATHLPARGLTLTAEPPLAPRELRLGAQLSMGDLVRWAAEGAGPGLVLERVEVAGDRVRLVVR